MSTKTAERARASIVCFLLLAATLISGVASARPFPPDEELEALLERRVETSKATGMVLGVLEADGSTRFVSFGSGGPGARPLGPRSVFEIGSITKAFTATILAGMAASGDISLADPIAQHLPDGVGVPSLGGREITLLDLSTHHSGLPRMPDNWAPADPANPFADYAADQLYAFLSHHELRNPAGSAFEYSNLGMGLLGHVLELAADKPFKSLVGERILEPLGMSMTGFELQGDMAAWMTKGHDEAGNVVGLWDVTTLAGAGGLRSNAADLLTFVAANLRTPATATERALRATHATQKQLDERRGIALNWQVRSIGERRILFHGGRTGGFRAMIGFEPDRGVGFVVLANSRDIDTDLGLDLLARVAPTVERTAIDVAEEILASYVGAYVFSPSFSIVITLEGGQLFGQATGQDKVRLFAESETTFFLTVVDAQVTFTQDEAGAVTGLTLHQRGMSRPAEKAD